MSCSYMPSVTIVSRHVHRPQHLQFVACACACTYIGAQNFSFRTKYLSESHVTHITCTYKIQDTRYKHVTCNDNDHADTHTRGTGSAKVHTYYISTNANRSMLAPHRAGHGGRGVDMAANAAHQLRPASRVALAPHAAPTLGRALPGVGLLSD